LRSVTAPMLPQGLKPFDRVPKGAEVARPLETFREVRVLHPVKPFHTLLKSAETVYRRHAFHDVRVLHPVKTCFQIARPQRDRLTGEAAPHYD
jgi:hypothetical protein